jgi:hypothetical protein
MRDNDAPDHIVTKEEFEEYYNCISCSIEDDDYFALMMNNAWNLDGSMVYQKGWSNKDANTKGVAGSRPTAGARPQTAAPVSRSRGTPSQASSVAGSVAVSQSDALLLDQIRKKVASRGARGIMGIGRLFRIYDDNNNKTLDINEAKKAFAELRLGLSDKDAHRAFIIFDRDGDKLIEYEEFLRTIRGEMN